MEGGVWVFPAAAAPSLTSPLQEVFSLVSVAVLSPPSGLQMPCVWISEGFLCLTCTWPLAIRIQLEPLNCPAVALATLGAASKGGFQAGGPVTSALLVHF